MISNLPNLQFKSNPLNLKHKSFQITFSNGGNVVERDHKIYIKVEKKSMVGVIVLISVEDDEEPKVVIPVGEALGLCLMDLKTIRLEMGEKEKGIIT